MKWEQGRRSDNVEDRRRSGGFRSGGGRRGVAIGGGGAIIVALIMILMGRDPTAVLNDLVSGTAGTEGTSETAITQTSAAEDRLADMCSVVLADTEDTWNAIFAKAGADYVEPKLVIFSSQVESACGIAQGSSGPFYCPGDQKVYIDLSFYQELGTRFGAPGDFAQAYVIAHEIGHHVQYLTGTMEKVHSLMQRSGQAEANALSVRLELQADFYAGIWAHYADKSRGLLDSGDLQEALGAAAAVGDDRIQKQTQGYVVPDSFTHGSSAQRIKYFKLGYETGDVGAFDLL
jgi:predicted metalloprotease